MSYTGSDLVACEPLQARLDETFFGPASRKYIESNPTYDLITDPMNTSGAIQSAVAVDGKLVGIKLKYFQRFLEDDVDFGDDPVDGCSTGNQSGESSKLYELDENVGTFGVKSITMSQLVHGCDSDEFYVSDLVMRMINTLEMKINTKIITDMVGLVGNFPTTGTNAAIDALAKSGSEYVSDLLNKVSYEFGEMDYNDNIIALGGSEIWRNYWSTLGAACCSTKQALQRNEVAQLEGIMPFYDRKVNTILGANKFFAMAPGAVQFLHYNRYGWSSARQIGDDSKIYGTIESPYSNMRYDYRAILNCETWDFYVGLVHDTVGAPDDQFNTADRMNGVTMLNQFTLTTEA